MFGHKTNHIKKITMLKLDRVVWVGITSGGLVAAGPALSSVQKEPP